MKHAAIIAQIEDLAEAGENEVLRDVVRRVDFHILLDEFIRRVKDDETGEFFHDDIVSRLATVNEIIHDNSHMPAWLDKYIEESGYIHEDKINRPEDGTIVSPNVAGILQRLADHKVYGRDVVTMFTEITELEKELKFDWKVEEL